MKNGKVWDKNVFCKIENIWERETSVLLSVMMDDQPQSVPRLWSRVFCLTTGSIAIMPWLATFQFYFSCWYWFSHSQHDIDLHSEHFDYFHPDVEYWPPVPGPVVLLVHPRESHIFTGSMLMLMCIDCSPPIARVSDQNISVKNMFTDVSGPGGKEILQICVM